VPVRLEESVDPRTRFREAETREGVTDESGIFQLTARRGDYSLTFQATLEHEVAPPLEFQLDSD
jgi:hypothetical protein